MADTEKTCTRADEHGKICGSPLDTSGYPKWCKACRKQYQSDRDGTKEEMAVAAGLHRFKGGLIAQFENLGGGHFSGYEVADLIRGYQVPKSE